MHANSAAEALDKLSLLPLLAGRNIDRSFIAPTLARTIDLVVHCVRDGAGVRRVQEVVSPTGEVVDGRIMTRRVFDTDAGQARGGFRRLGVVR